MKTIATTHAAQSTGVLVLGMHRSGTSALTRVLGLLGASLGERLMEAQPWNSEGHWESLVVYQAHQELLTAFGRRWDDLREMPKEWLDHPAAQRAGDAIARFVSDELAGQPLWAIKDPRMCRLLPLWLQALADFPVRLTAILAIRDPREVAASLTKRDGISHEQALLLWMEHVIESERASRAMPRLVVHYQDLLRDWPAQVDTIGKALDIAWQRTSADAKAGIEEFLSPTLRHHDVSRTSKYLPAHALPSLVERLYAASLRARHDPAGWTDMQAIADEMEQAAGLFGPCLDDLHVRQQLDAVRAASAEITLARGFAKPEALTQQLEMIKQARDESHAAFLEAERVGPNVVEVVKQIEALRQESYRDIQTLRQELGPLQIISQARDQSQAAFLEAERIAPNVVEAVRQVEALRRESNQQFELLRQQKNSDGLVVSLLEAERAHSREIESRLLAAEQQIKELLSSASWELTAPLRSIRNWFARRRGPKASSRQLRGDNLLPRRRWITRFAERCYRAFPLDFRRKRALKGVIFRWTGPLFRNTNAYRRWLAANRTHAPGIGDAATIASYSVAPPTPTPTLAQAPADDDGVRPADGHWEWRDYAVVRGRIDAELARMQQEKQAKPLSILDFSNKDLDKIASRIRIPAVAGTPQVTILVPAYNHVQRTLECLASIAAVAEPGGPSFEVLVADDASTDTTAELLALVGNARVVTQAENLGFLRNCNTAAKSARGEYLLLLNNDVQVTRGWLTAMFECISADPGIAAVGPKMCYPSGWLQEAGTALKRDGRSEMIGLNDLSDLPRYSYNRDVDYCSGACLLLRSADFRRLGGFDETYAPAYCEDADLCLRLRADGGRIVYCADACIVHHLSATSDALPSDYKLRCIARNLQKISERWQPELDKLDDVRSIAFYLPQFHPIPENDLWWGHGFTEWTNVSKARQNFVGHYQPRLPADLGFYDLRLPEVMEKQAALAQRYGIGGFCYYYYWFAGQRLLELPIENMLASGRPAMPYCLCWANENWTRRWDGEDHDVLMGQQHSDADDIAVIRDLIRHFRSENYIRINGKPLLVVYRVGLFPDFKRTADVWRQICQDEGIGDIYLAHVESFEMVSAGISPEEFGCDAAIEFPPHGMAQPRPVTEPLLNPDFQGAVADYRDLAVSYATRELPAYKRFLGVATGWDNTARRQNNSYCFEHATPGAFQAWLEEAIARTKQQFSGDERMVFINAWNEWAEGAYLEPDRRFGHSFLQAVNNAHDASRLVRQQHYSLG